MEASTSLSSTTSSWLPNLPAPCAGALNCGPACRVTLRGSEHGSPSIRLRMHPNAWSSLRCYLIATPDQGECAPLMSFRHVERDPLLGSAKHAAYRAVSQIGVSNVGTIQITKSSTFRRHFRSHRCAAPLIACMNASNRTHVCQRFFVSPRKVRTVYNYTLLRAKEMACAKRRTDHHDCLTFGNDKKAD